MLFQEWPAFLRQLDRHRQRNVAGPILQLTDRFQRRLAGALRREIEAEGLRELEQGNAVIILRRDQERILVGKRDLRLEDVKARHRPGFKTILLILQLALEKLDRFLLDMNQLPVEQDLIELLLHRRDHGVDRVSKREITAVPREIGRADLGNDAPAGEEHLGRFEPHIVRALDAAEVKAGSSHGRRRRPGRRGRRCGGGDFWSAVVHLQVRIDVLKLARHFDFRQDLSPHRNVETFRALDFLARFLDVGVALQRGQNCLVERETRNGRAPQTQFGERLSSRKKKRSERDTRQDRGAERETDGNFSHGWKTRDGQS